MYGPKKSRNQRGLNNSVRKDKLVSKILMRIITILESKGIPPTPAMMDKARAELEGRWSDHQHGGGGMSEKEIRAIVAHISHTRSETAPLVSATFDGGQGKAAVDGDKQKTQAESNNNNNNAQGRDTPASNTSGTSTPLVLPSFKDQLISTTRKQRVMMADSDWIRQAEEDRVNGIRGRVQEKRDRFNTQLQQRKFLDEQNDEHQEQQRQRTLENKRLQDEMTEHISNHRELTRQERQDAFDKSMRERRFREQQQQELDKQREQHRQDDHDEQVRHCMMVKAEIQRQRDDELNRKLQKKREWNQTLHENDCKLQEKGMQRERQREEDREFQREYEANCDREDQKRADAKARKAERQAYFLRLADSVAAQYNTKVQNLDDKIEAEFNEQERRSMEDEANRKRTNKQKEKETQRKLLEQAAEKKRNQDDDRDAARRLAEHVRQMEAEAKHQEQMRKLAQRQEAQRMKEFLNTQLQMMHYKETQALETSITRPMSRASVMYTPSRYSASPKPDIKGSFD